MNVTVIPIVIGVLGTDPKGLEESWRNWKLRKNRGRPDYSIVYIGQNTEKSPRDRRFGVTYSRVKYNQLTLVWKTCKE